MDQDVGVSRQECVRSIVVLDLQMTMETTKQIAFTLASTY